MKVLSLTCPSTHAFGSLGAHYAGTSADGAEVQLYLDGGKFLRQQGDFHVLQTDIRIQRNGRSVGTTDRCRYLDNPANHANNLALIHI